MDPLLLVFIIVLMLLIILALGLYYYYYPEKLLAPYNVLIGLTQYNTPIYTREETDLVFPQHKILENNWDKIREEANKISQNVSLPLGNPVNTYTTVDKESYQGWDLYPLRMFNQDFPKNMARCPITSSLIRKMDNITLAAFSILRPGKKLDLHSGPFKGIIRYHLGLVIPDGECYLKVNGERYDWKQGESILFDETYEHMAVNNTDKDRIILFLDVQRPIPNPILNWINRSLIELIKISPHNQKALKKYDYKDKTQHNDIPNVLTKGNNWLEI